MADLSPIYLFLVGEVLLATVFIQFLPQLTREDIFFAVTVPADFRRTALGQAILRGFRVESGAHAAIAVALILAGMAGGRLTLAMAGMFWQFAGLMIAFLRARRRVRPHAVEPATMREADLRPRTAQAAVPRLLQLSFSLPVLALGGLALYVRDHWDQIPQRFATHWSVTGAPDRWADRSIAGVYGGLVTGALVCSVMGLAAYATLRWSRRIHATGPAAVQEDRFRTTVATVLLLAGALVAAMTGWVSLLPLREQPDVQPSVAGVLVAALAFAVVVVTLLIRNRPGKVPATPGSPVGDRTADRRWKAGLFYFDPADPALLIEKRFGIGYTLNFGHPSTWLLLAVLVGGPWLVIVILKAI